MSHWDFGLTSAGQHHDPPQPAPDEDEELGPYPLTYERDPYYAPAPAPPPPTQPDFRPAPPATAPPLDLRPPPPPLPLPHQPGPLPEPGEAGGPPEDWTLWELPDGGEERPARRWLLPASIAVAAAALGAAATLLAVGHPSAPAGPGAQHHAASARPAAPGTQGSQATGASAVPSPAASAAAGSAPAPAASPAGSGAASGAPLTLEQARTVVAQYTAANNQANAARSDRQLAAIETGSSYAIDAGLYRLGRAASSPVTAAFAPVQATYYIPRGESGNETRWFAVRVANAPESSPGKITSTEYLLFTQSADGTWREAIEPFVLSGGSTPPVAVETDGLATAVTADASAVSVAPGELAAATAAALDGRATTQLQLTAPGNLADLNDARSWRKSVPEGQVSDSHATAPGTRGREFALLTADGGALVFYTDMADLTITAPAGQVLHVTLPGFYSASQSLAQAGLTYLEQFAAYDPPAGGGAPRIVADLSAITGTSSAVPGSS